jgi:hypothetical protein
VIDIVLISTRCILFFESLSSKKLSVKAQEQKRHALGRIVGLRNTGIGKTLESHMFDGAK